jgi:hypothetical protein
MKYLDDYPLPKAFKMAWRKEFGRRNSVEYLASCVRLIRNPVSGWSPEEEPSVDPNDEARLELTNWVIKAAQAPNAVAKAHNFFRAVKRAVEEEENPHPLSPYRNDKQVAMAIYFHWVRNGRRNITKQLLWDSVTDYFKQRGLHPPQNRARTLGAIGLEGLPHAKSGPKAK